MNYLISYDLNKSGKNYDGVYKAIKDSSTGKWCKPLESLWVIQSNLTTQEVYNRITPYLDSDDCILITEFTKNYYGYLSKEVADHLKGMM